MNVSKKWMKSASLYKFFAKSYPNTDFTDKAAEVMYDFETYGIGRVNHYHTDDSGKVNGYALGKHLMDIQLAAWFEDLSRPFMLTKYELLTDPDLKEINWFLTQQFGELPEDTTGLSKFDVAPLHKHISKYMV